MKLLFKAAHIPSRHFPAQSQQKNDQSFEKTKKRKILLNLSSTSDKELFKIGKCS